MLFKLIVFILYIVHCGRSGDIYIRGNVIYIYNITYNLIFITYNLMC